ncbi:hypothetical protein THAOC_33449, partial [Thalassiosira oceanica]
MPPKRNCDEDRKPAVPQGTKRRKPESHLAVAATSGCSYQIKRLDRSLLCTINTAPPKSPDGMPIMLSYNHGGPSPAGRLQMRNRPFLKVDNDGKIDLTNDDTDDDE